MADYAIRLAMKWAAANVDKHESILCLIAGLFSASSCSCCNKMTASSASTEPRWYQARLSSALEPVSIMPSLGMWAFGERAMKQAISACVSEVEAPGR